jgi:tetratricopeptide (TPR) repeat protein
MSIHGYHPCDALLNPTNRAVLPSADPAQRASYISLSAGALDDSSIPLRQVNDFWIGFSSLINRIKSCFLCCYQDSATDDIPRRQPIVARQSPPLERHFQEAPQVILRREQKQIAQPAVDINLTFLIAANFYKEEKYLESFEAMSSIPREFYTTEMLYLLAQLLKQKEQYAKAHAIYDEIFLRRPADDRLSLHDLKNELASMIFSLKLEPNISVDDLKILNLYFPEIYAKQLFSFYVTAGKKALLKQFSAPGHLKEAYDCFEEAIKYDAKNGRIWQRKCFLWGIPCDGLNATKWYAFGRQKGFGQARINHLLLKLQNEKVKSSKNWETLFSLIGHLENNADIHEPTAFELAQFYSEFISSFPSASDLASSSYHKLFREFQAIGDHAKEKVVHESLQKALEVSSAHPLSIPYYKKAALLGNLTAVVKLKKFQTIFVSAADQSRSLAVIDFCHRVAAFCQCEEVSVKSPLNLLKMKIEDLSPLYSQFSEQEESYLLVNKIPGAEIDRESLIYRQYGDDCKSLETIMSGWSEASEEEKWKWQLRFAKFYDQEGNYANALAALSAIPSNNYSAELHFAKGCLFMRLDILTEAYKEFENVFKKTTWTSVLSRKTVLKQSEVHRRRMAWLNLV